LPSRAQQLSAETTISVLIGVIDQGGRTVISIARASRLVAAHLNVLAVILGVVLVAGIVPAGGFVTPAVASSVLVDDGAYTYDPSTHLDWLDVTATTNLSYDDVIHNTGTSFVAEGWRYATAGALLKFYTDAGLPMAGPRDMYRTAQDADFRDVANAMLNLYDLVGIIDSGVTSVDHWYQTLGFYGPLGNDGKPGQAGLALDLHTDEIDSGLSAIIDAGILDADTRSTGFGSWLIRLDPTISAVPVPGALILFASGLMLMTLMMRRNRR